MTHIITKAEVEGSLDRNMVIATELTSNGAKRLTYNPLFKQFSVYLGLDRAVVGRTMDEAIEYYNNISSL